MENTIIKKLSIIIPVYNEANTLTTLLKKVFELVLVQGIEKEIILINDGSSDGTFEILASLSPNVHFQIHHLKQNRGKGNAIIEGLKHATGEYVIIQDADLEYNPDDINVMLQEMITQKFDVLYGSRNLGENEYCNIVFYAGGKLITTVTNWVYGQNLTDEATGYKLIKTSLLKSIELESQGFDFCIETTAKIAKLGYKIPEIPISYQSRSFQEGKKITTKDGIITFFKIFQYCLWKK